MQLNELINQYSLDTLVEKTKISKEVLERLANKEFEKFKKVQVFGFLKIIEREFNVDLSDVKAEAEEYFLTHNDEVHSSAYISILDAESSQNSGSGFMGILFAIFTIAIIAYGAWFFFNKATNGTVNLDSNSSKSESMFSQTINSAKSILSDKKNQNEIKSVIKDDSNRSKTEIKTTPTTNNEVKHKAEELDTSNQKNMANLSVENSKKNQDTTNSNSIDSNLDNTQNSSVDTTTNSSNNSSNNVNSLSNLTVDNDAISNESSQNSNEQSSEQNGQSSNKQTNNEQNSVAQSSSEQESSEDNISLNDANNQEPQTQNSAISSAKMLLKSKKLWIGIYNLDTKKRVSKFISKDFDLDLTKGKLAIVTGHSMFDIKIGDKVVKRGGIKKSYLLISQDDGVKVLTKKEYRALTKKRAW